MLTNNLILSRLKSQLKKIIDLKITEEGPQKGGNSTLEKTKDR